MIEKEYISNRIANANSAQLVAILYEGLIETFHKGIEHINNSEMQKLNITIQKSREILAELLYTLKGDSEIADNLRSLYVYVNKIATEAELKKDPAKLQEAIKVIIPLYEAWTELSEKEIKAGAPEGGPAIVTGITYGKGQLKDYVVNDKNRWEKG
jgi:flagellar secretion chaperone FliS